MSKEITVPATSTVPTDKRILVVGIVRNCSKSLKSSTRSIKELLIGLGQVSFFLVESDSSDRTLAVLGEFAQEHPWFAYKTMGSLIDEVPERISRITKCRNVYIEHLQMLMESSESPDYVVVADFDGVNSKLMYESGGGEILRPDTVVTSNQRGRYYDILALRSSGWVSEDYRIGVSRDITSGSDPLISFINNVSKKQIKISSKRTEIPVSSAFGGLAIYPAEPLSKCSYRTTELSPGVFECEHVKLHEDLASLGVGIIIAPFLQNVGERSHVALAGTTAKVFAYSIVYSGVLGLVRSLRNMFLRRKGLSTK